MAQRKNPQGGTNRSTGPGSKSAPTPRTKRTYLEGSTGVRFNENTTQVPRGKPRAKRR